MHLLVLLWNYITKCSVRLPRLVLLWYELFVNTRTWTTLKLSMPTSKGIQHYKNSVSPWGWSREINICRKYETMRVKIVILTLLHLLVFILWNVYHCTVVNNIITLRFHVTLAADLVSILTFLRCYNGKCFLRIAATDLLLITISFLLIRIDRKYSYVRWESEVVS
jgi:hypothetical protein